MATAVTPPPVLPRAGAAAGYVVALGLAGVVIEAFPSLLRVLAPSPQSCAAISPPYKECAPDLHLWVVAAAIGVLVVALVAARSALKRSDDLITSAVVLAGLGLVAVLAWSTARAPEPLFGLLLS